MSKNTHSLQEYEQKKKFYNLGFITKTEWEKYKENYKKFHKHYNKKEKENDMEK